VQWVRWSTLIGQLLFILVPTLILTHLRYGKIREPLRLRLPTVAQILVVLVGVFALQQVLQGYMMLQEAIPLPAGVQRWVDLIKDMFEATYRLLVTATSPLELLLVVLTVAVVPAVSEEVLFRGLVQRDLESLVGGTKSAVIAGLLFALYHLNPFSLVPLATLGIVFGLIVYRSGNLTLAMIAHFLNNFLASLALYYNIDEDFLMTAPEGGARLGLHWYVVFAVVGQCTTLYASPDRHMQRKVSHVWLSATSQHAFSLRWSESPQWWPPRWSAGICLPPLSSSFPLWGCMNSTVWHVQRDLRHNP
jgi:membrane protease YdiL (CAAX protease family)